MIGQTNFSPFSEFAYHYFSMTLRQLVNVNSQIQIFSSLKSLGIILAIPLVTKFIYLCNRITRSITIMLSTPMQKQLCEYLVQEYRQKFYVLKHSQHVFETRPSPLYHLLQFYKKANLLTISKEELDQPSLSYKITH